MKMSKVTITAGLSLAFLLAGCRTRQEAAGDKFRKSGDVINALFQYEEALKRGKLSREFPKHYAQINIQAMALRAKEDPTAEFLDILKDTVSSLLRQYPDAQNEALFAQALETVGMDRLKVGYDEGGIRFLETAEGLSNKPADVSAKVAAARKEFLDAKLKEIEGDYKEAASEPTAGIVADYKMNKLVIIFGKEMPEMKDLWSKIRKVNLNTYLMYDLEGLLPELDARINRSGVLLAVLKLNPGSTSTKVEVKAYNGSSGPIKLDGDKFILVDREGNSYKAAGKLGSLAKGEVVGKSDESKAGGLTFNHPAGIEPHYLEYASEAGVTRKYLP